MTGARRPKASDAEKISALSDLVIKGSSLRKAIQEVFGDARKFHEVISKDSTLRATYTAAMEVRADFLADEIVEISDTEPDANRARNRIGARTWLAGKLKPRTYSERLDINVSHEISISDALQAARGRLLTSPVGEIHEAQVIEVPALFHADPAPAEATEQVDPKVPDIFD